MKIKSDTLKKVSNPENSFQKFRGTRLTCFYILICLLSFTVACFVLNRAETQHFQSVKGSVLFYAGKDASAVALMKQLPANLGIPTVDLLSKTAGGTLYRLTGSREAASPTLVLPLPSGGQHIISGPQAVEQALNPLITQTTRFQLAKQALLLMSAVILLTLAFAKEISQFVSFLPVAGFVAVAAIQGVCLQCHFSGSTLSAIAPVLAVVYLSAGLFLFTFPRARSRTSYLAFLIVSAFVPTAQAYLLILDPKLCPACLSLTFISAAYFTSTLTVLSTSIVSSMAAPAWARPLMAMSLVLVFFRHSLVLAGQVKVEEPKSITPHSIIGTALAKYVLSSTPLQTGVLYVVTQDFCGACTQAEHDLDKLKLEWRKLPLCTLLKNEGCFNGKNLSFVTPLLLIRDSQDRIVFQRNGWVTSMDELSALETQIRDVQRRLNGKNKTSMSSERVFSKKEIVK